MTMEKIFLVLLGVVLTMLIVHRAKQAAIKVQETPMPQPKEGRFELTWNAAPFAVMGGLLPRTAYYPSDCSQCEPCKGC